MIGRDRCPFRPKPREKNERSRTLTCKRHNSAWCAKDDYFQTFYDPLGFGTYIAMSFLRRFPCLFIGCSMKDENLRRFLFHLVQESVGTVSHQQKFALLRTTEPLEDQLVDEILLFYGVQVVWMEDFAEIPGILCKRYTAVRGVSQSDWDALAEYRWGDSLD